MRKRTIIADVSHHQKDGVIKALFQNGIQGVIIRAGYTSANGINPDRKFEKFYKEAKREGMSVGTYFYIYDTTRKIAAESVARKLYDMIRTYEFDLPVFLDIENFPTDSGVACQKWTADCLNELEKHKLFVGIYGSDINTFRDMFSDGRALAKRYYSWVARYGRDPQYIVNPDMHQYTDEGELNLYNGNVDLSYMYRDVRTTIIEGGFNGNGI